MYPTISIDGHSRYSRKILWSNDSSVQIRKKTIKTVWERYTELAKPEGSYTGERRYPDTIPTLEQLAFRYHLGIIANQGTGLVERWVTNDIAHYFELIVSSAETGIKKPSPDIFTYVSFCTQS